MLRKSSSLRRASAKWKKRVAAKRTKDDKARAAKLAWDTKRKSIYDRERGKCRAFGWPTVFILGPASKRGDPKFYAHCHHLVFRSALGDDSSGNLISISWEAHDMIHGKHARYAMDAEGNGNGIVRFTLKEAETGKVLKTWTSEPTRHG